MPIGDQNQPFEAPLVQQQGQRVGPLVVQSHRCNTFTSTSISSRAGSLVRSQETEQQRQDEELVEPPTTSGRANRELCQTLRDAKEFIGAPRTNKGA